VRKLDGELGAIRTPDAGGFQLYGLFGEGAHLFANQAGGVLGPGDAAVLVDIGQADDRRTFLIEGERRDGLDRAGLAAGIAGIVAVAQARHQDGGSQPLQSGLEDGRLQPASGTNPDTFVTARAFGEGDHVGIGLTDAGRADQVGGLAFGERVSLEQGDGGDGRADGKQGIPATGIVGGAFFRQKLGDEAGEAARADFQTIKANGAFGGVAGVVPGRVNGAGGADIGAEGTALTLLGNPPSEDGDLAEQAQAAAERAQVAAPEAGGQQVQQEQSQENGGGQQAGAIENRLGRQHERADETVKGGERVGQEGHIHQGRFQSGDDPIQGWPEADGEGAQEQGERIEKQQAQVPKQSGREDEDDQVEFDLAPAIRRGGAPAAPAVEREQIQNGAERAEPAAPSPAKDEREKQDDQGQRGTGQENPAGEQVGQDQERIQAHGDIDEAAGTAALAGPDEQGDESEQGQVLDGLPESYPRAGDLAFAQFFPRLFWDYDGSIHY